MGYSTLSGKEKAGQARTNENQILEGSKLYIGEVRHRMYESVLRLFASDQDSASLLSEKKQKNLADRMKTQLRQEILRALVQNKDYLELKDIGSRRKSYQERMFEELRRLRVLFGNERKDLFSDILDQNERKVLKYFGIPCPDEIKEEKKAEEKTEKKAAAEKAEEKKAGKKAAAEKKEEKKTEPEVKAEEKKEEHKEEKKEEKIGDNLDGEIQKQVNLHYEMPEIDYKKNVQAPEKGEHVPYESQGDSTYCWACVMSGLMNAHAGKKVSDLNDIRKKPLAIPAFEESGVEKKENYDAGVDLVNGMYDGTVYGNPAIFGDYIFDKLPDTAVRTAIISREPERLAYAKRRFLETLSKNLEKGPVGFLHAGHFVLVRGLEGEKLKVNDSMSATPDQLVDYDQTVSELFAASGQQLELVWLEDLKGQEVKIAEEFNLNYDARKQEFALKQDGVKKAAGQGEVSHDQPKNEQTILHRNGVEATAQFYDDVVYSSVYVPKKLTQNTAEKNAEKVVEQPVEKAAEQQVEKAAEQQAEKIVEKSRDDVAEGLVQGALGAAMKELEQEELKKDSSGKLPATPAEYYAEVKRIVMVNKDKLSDGFARVSAMAPSDYFAVGSQENRFMSRQIGMLSYFGKLKDSELNEAFYALMVNTKTATVRQKTLKAREYERLFEQILDFDIRKLNIKSIRDAFSSECMDAAVMASALFDCHPSMMRDYEDLLKDPAVRTSLSEDEFKEIKARWEMIHSNFSWVSDAPKYEETIRENKIDIDEVLSMSTKQLMDLVNHTSDSRAGDPKLNEFYVWILTQKTMWASEGYEGPGDDVEALLQKKRTSDRYMLPEDKSYAEDAKKKLRARLAEDEGKIFDRNIETSLEPTLEKQLKKVEEQFKGTGVSKSALSDMKKTTKAVFRICEEQNNAISKSTLDALKETSKGTIDIRGIAPLLRPVKLNKDNQPATEEDMRNRKLNEKDVKNLSTNRLSDRVEFLERVVGEARDIMFTVEELKDHKFILKNRERAIKHMRLMHNLLNLYTYHENYFLNQAPAETRDFMFMLASASEYVNFQAYHIQNALQEKGLGAVPLGGSSSLLYTLQYDGFFDYKTVVSVNKKLSKLGSTAAQFYYGNIIGLKPIIDTEDPDELDIPAMLEDARLEAIEDAKKRKITDSVLSPASRMILAGELPKGTETYDDKDNERIMAKYLDLFASKNKAKLKNKAADRKKLKAYIDEYKSKNKIANQEGLNDD